MSLSDPAFNTDRRQLLKLAAATALATPTLARAAWPDRPIRLVVPSAAGGAADVICRIVANELAKLVGTANHGRSLETLSMIEAAAKNQSVCMDCYPYNASSTMLLPARVLQSSDVLVTWSKTEPQAAGRSLFELAKERNQSPEDVAKALQCAGAIYFAMDEGDVSRILSHPLAMVGSDGLAHDVQPHPRLWGTFPRVLGRYVREQRLLSLELAIYKMTGLSARRFGLKGRGALAIGNFADVVIFDEHQVIDRASFQQPTQVSTGIDAVFVNGVLACEQGHTTHRHAGRVLRRA